MTAAHREVRALVGALIADGPPAAAAPLLDAIRERLEGPLRIAIAGRVKAGKSTLLNALVGERLAPTDAGESTRLVTWYHEGLGYDVRVVRRDGSQAQVTFARGDGRLQIDLGALALEELDRLDVAWPSSALREVTLIDTPGLASIHDEHSLRTREFLALGDDRASDADAVIYLIRHLHRRDSEFLASFLDRSVVGTSPANAIGVLSRADEIGAGRLDALQSAARVAARYRDDPSLRPLCATVLPIAGLLAETGLTLREPEFAALRAVGSTRDDVVRRLLLSADDFAAPERSPVDVAVRRELLGRFGMFGLRFALEEIRTGRTVTAKQLSGVLVEASGLRALWHTIRTQLMPRTKVLKARSAVVALRSIARSMGTSDATWSSRVAGEAERLEAAAHEFAELRLQHLVMSEAIRVSEDEQREIARVTGSEEVAGRLGVEPEESDAARQTAALAGIARWRSRASDPLADSALIEAAETMARAYEAAYASSLADGGRSRW